MAIAVGSIQMECSFFVHIHTGISQLQIICVRLQCHWSKYRSLIYTHKHFIQFMRRIIFENSYSHTYKQTTHEWVSYSLMITKLLRNINIKRLYVYVQVIVIITIYYFNETVLLIVLKGPLLSHDDDDDDDEIEWEIKDSIGTRGPIFPDESCAQLIDVHSTLGFSCSHDPRYPRR